MRRRPSVVAVLLGLLVLGSLGRAHAQAAAASSPWTLVAEGGVLDLDGNGAGFAGLEARHRPLRWGIFPLGGFLVSAEDSLHVRAGLGRDFRLGERWVATVSSAVGYWGRGDGPHLGSELEFRSALDLAFRFHDDLRVGLTLAHLSNASTAETNPGIETLALSIAWRP